MHVISREDHRACMQKSMRVEVSVFDGYLEPKDFIDWESSMNSYFRWYREARTPYHYLGRDGPKAAEQVCSVAVQGDALLIVA